MCVVALCYSATTTTATAAACTALYFDNTLAVGENKNTEPH